MDDVTVTIGGANPADVYATNANYSSNFGGNDSTNGTFAGAGANAPQALDAAPAFDDSPRPVASTAPAPASVRPPTHSATAGNDSDWRINSIRKPTGILKVGDSGELVSLVNPVAPGHHGSLTVPNSNSRNNARNSGRRNGTGRSNADRRAMNIPTASPTRPRGLPH